MSSEIFCLRCRHYHLTGSGLDCDAFPNGIPDEILEGTLEHDEPVEGDNGVTFEPVRDGNHKMEVDV